MELCSLNQWHTRPPWRGASSSVMFLHCCSATIITTWPVICLSFYYTSIPCQVTITHLKMVSAIFIWVPVNWHKDRGKYNSLSNGCQVPLSSIGNVFFQCNQKIIAYIMMTKLLIAICHARDLWKLARFCKQSSLLSRPVKFTRYWLTQWISKLPDRFEIHWVR